MLDYGIFYDIFINNVGENYQSTYNELINLLRKTSNNIISLASTNSKMPNNDLNDAIEMSKFILLCLTNEFIISNEFNSILTVTKKFNKMVVFVLMEKIDQNNSNVTNMIEMNEFRVLKAFESNNNCFESLEYFIDKFFGKKPEILKPNIKYTKFLKFINKKDKFSDILFDHKKNDQLIVGSSLTYLYVYERSTLTLKEKLCYIANSLCFIDHMNCLCLFHNYEKSILFLDEKYKILRIKMISPLQLNAIGIENLSFDHVSYKNNTKYTYVMSKAQKILLIFNEEFDIIKYENVNSNTVLAMKLYKERLFLLELKQIHVYDANLNFIASFGQPVLESAVDIIIDSRFNRYIYVLEHFQKCFKVFSLNSFGYLDSFHTSTSEFNLDRAIMIGNQLIITASDYLYMHEIIFRSNSNRILSEYFKPEKNKNINYICCLNSTRFHLLSNPYMLPCGNAACLKCIYENFNIYTNKIECNYETCMKEHSLSNQIEKLNIMEENLKHICSIIVKYSVENSDLRVRGKS